MVRKIVSDKFETASFQPILIYVTPHFQPVVTLSHTNLYSNCTEHSFSVKLKKIRTEKLLVFFFVLWY